jgi:hypothetical protein
MDNPTTKIPAVKVSITRWVENYPPGIIECSLTDTQGQNWLFILKQYDATAEDLDENSYYPQPGVIACTIIETKTDAAGREIVLIDTDQPRGIESRTEHTRFMVYRDQLVEF